jgi:hypothetical protein
MDTNQSGVSIDDLAGMLGNEPAQDDLEEREEEVLESQDGQEAEPEPTEDDFVEAEYEGKAYKVPKELKDALLRQADYTRKTQEVAETRKQIEERAQLLVARERFQEATFEKAVELRDVQNKLSQFERIDWQSLTDNDPVQAQKLLIAQQQLQQEAAKKQQELQHVLTQREQLATHHRQQVLEQAQKDLRERLPDFGAETAEKIKSTARTYGITDQELEQVIDPRYVHVLHDAMKWRELQANRPQALKKVADAPRVVRPQAQQPKPRTNQAAAQRLQKFGRVEDLAALL